MYTYVCSCMCKTYSYRGMYPYIQCIWRVLCIYGERVYAHIFVLMHVQNIHTEVCIHIFNACGGEGNSGYDCSVCCPFPCLLFLETRPFTGTSNSVTMLE